MMGKGNRDDDVYNKLLTFIQDFMLGPMCVFSMDYFTQMGN